MSDGIGDIMRENMRNEYFRVHLDNLLSYLKHPTNRNYGDLKKSVEDVDSVRGGYFTRGKTNFLETFEEKTKRLLEGDEHTWIKFLSSLVDPSEFEKISPFVEDEVDYIKYGYGFVVSHEGPLESLVHEVIRKQKFEAKGGDEYTIVIPHEGMEKVREILKSAKVIQIK